MTARPDLVGLISKRDPRTPSGVFNVAAIPGFSQHFVGRDDAGRACVLLGSADSGTRAPGRLGGLNVQYALTCAVRMGVEGEEQRVLTVVTSTGETVEAERYFLHIIAALLEIVGDSPNLVDLAESITQLAGIFQRLTGTARESIAGVVGELVLIAAATNPAAAAAAWRSDPDERYDFSTGQLRLEMKSSMTRRRVHSFSFEQCDVPSGCRGVVGSIFVERSAGGLTLEGLLDIIANRLTKAPHAMFRVQQTLAQTLGAGLPDALSFSFDYPLACTELAFFELQAVPAIRGLVPPFVSQVRFISDISATPRLSVEALCADCPDFGKLSPVAS